MVPSFKGSLCLCPHGEGVIDMSRKSKKGFKKLENHELVSFQQGDSESESELLDLAAEGEPAGRSRYNRKSVLFCAHVCAIREIIVVR